MSRTGTYLYGIVRAGAHVPAGLPAIEEDAAVCVFNCGRLAALTTLVPRDDFESTGPAGPAWVVPRALRHQLLIEKLAPHGPVLPVRFGALFSTPAALEAWLSFNNDAITAFLDHVAGKEEWALKVDVELGAAFEALVAQDPEWAEQARLLPDAPVARYFQEKRLRQTARRHVRQTALAATEMVRAAARSLAEERVLVPRKSEQIEIEPVAHLAYLVARDLVPALLDRVRHAAGNAACLRLVPTGPWPPAHFCPPLTEPPGQAV